MEPQNTKEALTLALKLAITAPTDDQVAEVVEIAESLAVEMDAATVDECKALALAELEIESYSLEGRIA